MKRRRQRRKKKLAWLLRLLALLGALATGMVLLDREVRPVVLTMAQYQARVSSILAINEAVLEEMEREAVLYEDLVQISRGSSGEVTSIQADAAAVNRVKARLTRAVSNRLAALQLEEVTVPLGTLLGWQFFSGKGPQIGFQVVPASYVESDVRSSLQGAGINQTQHKLLVEFRVEMSAIIPGYTTSVEVTTQVCIADTLIVGEVPQFYAVAGLEGADAAAG